MQNIVNVTLDPSYQRLWIALLGIPFAIGIAGAAALMFYLNRRFGD